MIDDEEKDGDDDNRIFAGFADAQEDDDHRHQGNLGHRVKGGDQG